MRYYNVKLGTERHWKSGTFTYGHIGEIPKYTLVRVPFGKVKKTAVIIGEVTKPKFAVKEIEEIFPLKLPQALIAFADWYSNYYNAEQSLVYAQLIPQYLKSVRYSAPKHAEFTYEQPALQKTQADAVKKLCADKKPSVLHGITGSGKTRVYISLLLRELRKGNNALLLYPEISLTPQIAEELAQHAPLVVFHSQLTDVQRAKLWLQVAMSSEPQIIIGPRSALFLPHHKLGIIIIDEAHESSYKQETGIHYNALHVAAGLAHAHNAKLILGSATPPVAETTQILERGGQIICMHRTALPQTEKKLFDIIDSRNRAAYKKHPLLSDRLLSQIKLSLELGEQVMLFLNRRGTAKIALCSNESCEWQATCSACELPLTYHHDLHSFICHTCGQKSSVVSSCPLCSSAVSFKSLGSKAIVEEVQGLFPVAKIARFDSDNTKKTSFASMYQDVKNGTVDILIGTQQIIKGLDLPKLRLIGIINADLTLHFPDFSSDERTFQLITQAIGRVGRGHRKGHVVIQTLQPHNPTMQLAIQEDWHQYYEAELTRRRQHGFPPFIYFAKLSFRQKSLATAEKQAARTKKIIEERKLPVRVDGPLASFHAKRGLFHYQQLHLSAPSRKHVLAALKDLPDDPIIDLDPVTLL